MGTFRPDLDPDYEHEGFVLSEIDIDDPVHERLGQTPRRWIGYWSTEVAGHFTGRYQPGCECGWRGPVIDRRRPDESGQVDAGSLPEEQYDAMLAGSWMGHLHEVAGAALEVARRVPSAAVRVAAQALVGRRNIAGSRYLDDRALATVLLEAVLDDDRALDALADTIAARRAMVPA